MNVFRPAAAWGAAVALASIATPPTVPTAASQEIGALFGPGWTESREISSPWVLGASFEMPLPGPMVVVADYRHHRDAPAHEGRIGCPNFFLSDDCRVEAVEGHFRIRSVGVGLGLRGDFGERVTGGVDVQRSWFRADGEWRGRESGSVRRPNSGLDERSGWSAAGTLWYRLRPRIALRGGLRWAETDGPFGGWVVDGVSFFPERTEIVSLEAGISFHWGRRAPGQE